MRKTMEITGAGAGMGKNRGSAWLQGKTMRHGRDGRGEENKEKKPQEQEAVQTEEKNKDVCSICPPSSSLLSRSAHQPQTKSHTPPPSLSLSLSLSLSPHLTSRRPEAPSVCSAPWRGPARRGCSRCGRPCRGCPRCRSTSRGCRGTRRCPGGASCSWP